VATPGTSAPPVAATEAEGNYIVKRDESLAEIASKFGLTEGQLLERNGIRNRDFIFEGQQLAIKPGVQPPAQVLRLLLRVLRWPIMLKRRLLL
jgi:LysM repeat protein